MCINHPRMDCACVFGRFACEDVRFAVVPDSAAEVCRRSDVFLAGVEEELARVFCTTELKKLGWTVGQITWKTRSVLDGVGTAVLGSVRGIQASTLAKAVRVLLPMLEEGSRDLPKSAEEIP